MSARATPRDYRQSDALRRSARQRPDGRPVWPLLAEDLPSHFTQPTASRRPAGATR